MMKYCNYVQTVGDAVVEGVCHKSKLEYLATPGATVSFTVIDDEKYAELVESYGGVEAKSGAKAKLKKA